MNEFDQFIKRELKIKYYIRYADDFVILSENKNSLEKLLPLISKFLETKLGLFLNQNKVFIKTFVSGADFLGWVNFYHYRLLRTSTKRKIIKKLKNKLTEGVVASYRGLLNHGNTYKLSFNLFKDRFFDNLI